MEGSRIKRAAESTLFKRILTYKYVILAVLLGALLLLLPDGKAKEAERGEAQLSDFDRGEVQHEMEEILSAIEGTGRLRLMLTVRGGGTLSLAQDRTLTSRQAESGDECSDKTETVVLGSGNNAEVVVTEQRYPDYVGALVVCEGGDSPNVRLQVTQAVSALTGLASDKISVIKGKP